MYYDYEDWRSGVWAYLGNRVKTDTNFLFPALFIYWDLGNGKTVYKAISLVDSANTWINKSKGTINKEAIQNLIAETLSNPYAIAVEETETFVPDLPSAREIVLDIDNDVAENDGSVNIGLFVYANSTEMPVISVTGLPSGVKFDPKTMTISGKVTKPGDYDFTVTATLKTTTENATWTLTAPNFTTEMFIAAGLETYESYDLWAGIPPAISNVFTAIVRAGWKLSVSGLPPGIFFDAKNNTLKGVATKEGVYTVTFTAMKSSEKQIATATFHVEFPMVGVDVVEWYDWDSDEYDDGDDYADGVVSGEGAYQPGKKVTLKATPAKGSVFVGWYLDGWYGDEYDVLLSRDTTYSLVMPEDDIWISAVFATAQQDARSFRIAVADATTAADGTFSLNLGACIISPTQPKLAVSGLPSGISFNAKTGVISGKATKPGTYNVTVSATKASMKKTVTATFKIVVPNLKSNVLPRLKQDKEAYGVVMCGVDFDADRIDCTHEAGWTVKVTGLPAGLKYDAKKNRITGVATKAGTYTVTFTASKKGKKNEVATITLNVEALPKWAIGTFTGNVKLKMENGELEEVYGTATMTVGAAGKISGKIAIDGTNWTFSAASYASVEWPDGLEQLDDLDNLGDDRVFVVEATAKAGKATRAIVVEVGNGVGDGVRGAPALPAVAEGTFGECEVKMWRNVWKDTGMAQLLATWKGAYDYLTDDGEPLTLTIDANGGVKVAGTLANGRKLSFSTSLLYADEDWYWAILYAPPATETVKKGKKKVKVAYPAFYEETEFYNHPGEPIASERIAYRRQGVLASVSADSTGSGSIKYSTAYGQAPVGATVTVTATPAKNSVFAYWTLYGVIAGYSASYKLVMCDGDFTGLEAVFRAKSEFKQKPPEPFVVDDEGGDPFAGLRVGVAFRARIDVDPEWHPVKFAAKNLPDGLKLNATTGVISGVPTKAGAKTVSFTATSVVNTKLVSPALKLQVNVAKRGG